MPFDLPSQFVDAACGASHKWLCAPEGCGIMYLSDRARERIQPTSVGGSAWKHRGTLRIASSLSNRTLSHGKRYRSFFAFLWSGTESQAVKWRGLENIETYLSGLTDYLCDRLGSSDYNIASSRKQGARSQIVCVKHHGGRSAKRDR